MFCSKSASIPHSGYHRQGCTLLTRLHLRTAEQTEGTLTAWNRLGTELGTSTLRSWTPWQLHTQSKKWKTAENHKIILNFNIQFPSQQSSLFKSIIHRVNPDLANVASTHSIAHQENKHVSRKSSQVTKLSFNWSFSQTISISLTCDADHQNSQGTPHLNVF